MDRYEQLEQKLDDLEQQMKLGRLWSNQSPDPQALESVKPFCVDTLSFEQWLQFVMIPRFRVMIMQRMPLPAECDITPMAEEVFKQKDVQGVIAAIKGIDQVVTLKN
jgi:uncharacterized protein YqcC (DUF446 family)